jgi:hypothetical protein
MQANSQSRHRRLGRGAVAVVATLVPMTAMAQTGLADRITLICNLECVHYEAQSLA